MSMRAIFGFSALLLSAVASPPHIAHAEETRTVVTTDNGDYFGFDLRTVQDVTLDQCKTDCIDDMSCRAFTYNPKVKWCFLKSDFNQLNHFQGAVAGKIVKVNSGLGDNPGTINTAPTTDGWFFKIEAADVAEVAALMDEAAYAAYVDTLA